MFCKVMRLNLCKISYVKNIYQTCCYCSNQKQKEEIILFFQQNLGMIVMI